MALSLPAAFLSAGKAAAQPPPTASPTTKEARPLTPVDSAKAEAKKASRQVEIPSLHTEASTTYANTDGKTLSTEFHTDPIRFKQGAAWRTVDTTLVADNGTIKPRATKAGLTLSTGGSSDLLTVKRQSDGSTVKISAPQKLSAPKLSGNRAEYANAYGPGIDLAVIATPAGFRQEVVIRQRPTTPLKLPVPIQLPAGLSLDQTSPGKLALRDSAAEAKRRTTEIPAPQLVDAGANLSVGEEGKVGKVTTAVERTAAGQAIVYKPDATFLADPDVTYPVTLAVAADVIWTQLPNGNDTFINNSAYQNGYANSGAYHLQAGKTNDGTVRWRTYIRFEDIPEDSPLRGGRVTNADLRLWNIDSNDCGLPVGSGITARRITQRWDVSTLTWSNQPTVTNEDANTEYGAYKPGCGRGYMDYEWYLIHYVNGIAQDWADGQPNYGFQLTSGNESENTNWRAYRSKELTDPEPAHGPKLIIGYEPAEIRMVAIRPMQEQPELPDILTDAQVSAIEDPLAASAPTPPPVSQESVTADAISSPWSLPVDADTVVPPPGATEEEIQAMLNPTLLPGSPPGWPPDPDPVPDPTPTPAAPTVVGTTPAANATNVSPAASIQVTFNEPVQDAQITLKDAAGIPVAGGAAMDDTGMLLTFTPAAALAVNTGYTVEVSQARNMADKMMQPYLWSFTTGAGTTDPNPPEGLVAAYAMDEGSGVTIADSSTAQNVGEASNTGWADGKYGKALSFNGTSSWVTIADSPSLHLSQALTLSAWVRPSALDDWRAILMKDHATGGSFGLYASNGSVPSGWFTPAGGPVRVNGANSLVANLWTHVAVTYDGTMARLYVNGEEAGTAAVTAPLLIDDGALRIGGDSFWGEYFAGLIDEVRVYSRAQTPEQIQSDMNTPIGDVDPDPDPAQTLVAAYGMNAGSGSDVADDSGTGNLGTASDTAWVAGKYGQALSFNGTSSRVTVGHSPSLRMTEAMTVSAWVRPAALDGWRSVVLKELPSGENASYGLYASNGSAPAGWLVSDMDDPVTAVGPAPLPLNTWSHIAVVYDGAYARLFVNGNEAATVAMSGPLLDDGGTLRIGGNDVWGEYFSGVIDEVRVYSTAQTATQIQTDMNTPVAPADGMVGKLVSKAAKDGSPKTRSVTFASDDWTKPDRIGWTDCRNDNRPWLWKMQVNRVGGWLKNRSSWCFWDRRGLLLLKRIPEGWATEGKMYYRLTILGETVPNSREFKFKVRLDEFDVESDHPYLQPSVLQTTVELSSTGSQKSGGGLTTDATGASCQPLGSPRKQTKYRRDWATEQEATYDFLSPKTGWRTDDNSGELRHLCNISVSVSNYAYGRLIGEGGVTTIREAAVVVRCDSASYLWSAGGCIFEGITPVLNIRRNVGYNTQWAHLKFARDHMNATYPQLGLPKKIPGFSKNSLLTRCYYSDICGKKGKNRKEARKACRAWFGANYSRRYAAPPGGQVEDPSRPDEPDGILDDGIVDYPGVQGDCDEYPFNATYEGSSQAREGKYNFSVYVINGPENQTAGNAMNLWANKDRMVDGDKFWVDVRP